MKPIILILSILAVFSCTKNDNQPSAVISDEARRIDSINVQRKKWNDSITIKNQQNVFRNEAGTHRLKFSSDEVSALYGTIVFEQKGRDFYEVSGNAKSGQNSLKVSGNIKKVTEKHLNFEGEISQKINGNSFKRAKNTTFLDEGKGSFWRLQNKINADGFVDYIDIYFN